jgi:dephospho-CoA kinase
MSIMATQVTRERRLAKADDIIRNDRDISYLVQQVADLDSRYRAMAASANQ